MDLSKLSTGDLIALRDNDLSRVSTEGLKYLQAQLNPPKQAGFTESFKEAFGTLGAAPAAARFATAETPEEKAAARRELLEKTKSEYETTSFADIKDLPSAVDWASQVAGSSAGFLAAPAAAALVNPVAGIGALASQYTTSGLTRQAQEQEAALARGEMPEETSVGKALAAAGVQTGLDYLGFKFFKPVFSKLPGLSKFFSTDADTATGAAQAIVDAAQAGKYSIKNGVFKGLAGGVAFEVPQEIAQSVLDRWQAGQPISPADPEARAEYYESAAGAVLLGGTLGAGSGFMQNRAKLKEAEELKAKARAEREAQQKALDKATAEEAEVEKEKKRKERELAKEDAKEKGKLELETAADIARKTITEAESEENALRNELMARMGLGRAEASELVKQLVRNKVLKYDKDTGLHTIREAEAPPAFDLANIKKPEEPKKEEAKKEEAKKEDEIPYGEKEGEEAKKPPTPAVEPQKKIVFPPPGSVTETTTDASDQTGTERPVTGADTGGVESPVSGPSATGSVTAGTEPTGMGGTLDVPDVGDAGKETVEPALKPEKSSKKSDVEKTALLERKAPRKAALDELTGRLNALRQTASENGKTIDDEAVVEILELMAEVEKTYEQFNKLPQNLTEKYADKESKLDTQISVLNKKVGLLQELSSAQTQPVKSQEQLAAELLQTENEARDRARREEIGGLSKTEEFLPVNVEFENALSTGADDALKFIDDALYERTKEENTAAAREISRRVRTSRKSETETTTTTTNASAQTEAKPETLEAVETDTLAEEIADDIAQKVKRGESIGEIGGSRQVDKNWKRKVEQDIRDALAGLVEALRTRVSFKDTKIQIEGRAGANPDVFERLRRENKLAEYDPATNTFYFTKDGVSRKVFLHEAVHAATIKILRAYQTNPASLTQSQRDAAEHITKIYEEAKKRLNGRFPNAFENVYEFVSETATDRNFQRELSKIVRPNLAKYTKRITNLWDQFTEALARMFGLGERTSTLEALQDAFSDRPSERTAARRPKPRTIEPEELVDSKGKRLTYPIPKLSTVTSVNKGYRGNLLLETSLALQHILSTPEKVEGVAPLPARRQPKRQKVAQFPANATEQELLNSGLDEQELRTKRRASLKGKQEFLWGRPFWDRLVRTFQNDRRVVQTREEGLTKAGKTAFFGDKVNSVSSLISLSSGQAYHNFMTQWEGTKASLKQSMDKINTAVYDYAKAMGVTSEEALNDISLMLAARHEPERRFVKFLLNVPLSNDPKNNVTFAGVTATPAKMRDLILKTLHENTEKGPDGKALLAGNGTVDAMRAKLEELAGYKNGVKVGPGFIDTVNGLRTNETKPTATSGDLDSEEYNVIGVFAKDNIKTLNDRFERLSKAGAPTAEPLKNLVDAMQDYQEASKYLDRQANYWSVPVDNITRLYNFKSYVPLKGYGGTEVSRGDDRFEIGKRIGGEYIESSAAFEGRQTLPDNVVAQVLVDGTRAAMRAARKDVTLAIKNLKLAGGLKAKKIKTIPFSERYKGIADLQAEKGETKIFHYMPDGSIEIWEIRDKAYLHGVRRMYEQANPYWDFANRITSGIGHLHTRYNPAFYPYNFVRDTLTNAFTLGTEMNRAAAFQYLGAVAANVAKNKFSKANKISRLYAKGDVESIKKMAQTDEFARDVLRYLQLGGRVSYIQGLALEGQLETLEKQISKNKFATTGETVNRWIDAWADMFEFTSRVSAFNVARNQFQAEGLSKEDAEVRAAAYAKNLANFEQVGELGRKAGALFMFFRPAATGAVRAIDSLMPLFEDVDSATKRLPEDIQSDPQAVLTFRQNHLRQREAAKTMLLSVAGAGAVIYTMALMGSDDDESGRNRVQTDDMALWTRNIRLPLSVIGKEGYLQIPWGFGIGAFAAAGAQIAGAAAGPTNVRDMAGNLVTILLDSYVPIPVSRINPLENPGAWALDSMMPSAVRPVLEFMMNVDGLGREIYNNRMTKYGDAYTGGRNTPIIFKDAADVLFKITNGDVQVSPDTMHFFANNYVDGAARILGSAYGLGYTLEGTKDFNAKEDFILVSSFLGRQGNFDAREFASVEKKIKNHEQAWNALLKQAEFKQDYSDVMRYLERYPNIDMMIKLHNKVVNSNLKDIREDARAVQSNPNVTPKQKKEVADQANLMQNFYKRQLIDLYKQYGLEP